MNTYTMDLEEVCFIGHEWKEIKKCTFKIVICMVNEIQSEINSDDILSVLYTG